MVSQRSPFSTTNSCINQSFHIAKPAIFQSYFNKYSVENQHRSSIQVYKSESCEIDPQELTLFTHFDKNLIAVLSLKVSQVSDNLSIKITMVTMNIDNSLMAISVFVVANFQSDFNAGILIN